MLNFNIYVNLMLQSVISRFKILLNRCEISHIVGFVIFLVVNMVLSRRFVFDNSCWDICNKIVSIGLVVN